MSREGQRRLTSIQGMGQLARCQAVPWMQSGNRARRGVPSCHLYQVSDAYLLGMSEDVPKRRGYLRSYEHGAWRVWVGPHRVTCKLLILVDSTLSFLLQCSYQGYLESGIAPRHPTGFSSTLRLPAVSRLLTERLGPVSGFRYLGFLYSLILFDRSICGICMIKSMYCPLSVYVHLRLYVAYVEICCYQSLLLLTRIVLESPIPFGVLE